MGKKVKKEENKGPDDVFDTLNIESKNAETVVLMLSSPEEDVLTRACEAIYKFVEKCDENRKTMLELNSVEHLLRLVLHEDRVVKRNACMALGVMTQNVAVRRFLRKREESVPALVQLLSPEEDTLVHEFACLALSQMCNEFSTKVAVFECNGLPPLIACLSEADPDVQKNAIEAIALMLQDYQSRTALREQGGFQPMLELLYSEFAVIQQLTLVALARATQDPENRGCLRELEGMTKLVDFIGRPEFNDLHTFAVVVLSNMLEDPESMQLIKETGGLAKLVALITDTQPPEEDSKKEKRGPSKAGKGKDKGKDDDKKGKADGKPPAGGAAGTEDGEIVPTLPEVKEHAARAIARSAKNADNRKLLHESETEKMLVQLLQHESSGVQCAAAQALAVMAESSVCRDAIGKFEGVAPLIKLLASDSGEVREAAALALANLTTASQNNCSEVANLGGIDPLIRLLADSKELASANAAATLTNLAVDESMRAEMAARGAVSALVSPLRSKNVIVQAKVALAVAAFACDADSRAEFRSADGIPALVPLVESGNDEVRKSAAWATCVCASDEPTALDIAKAGGLKILQQIQLSTTRANRFADAALSRLLDSNLPAKYSLTGQLGPGNIIQNGFYDCGPLRPGAEFQALEVLGKQEVNNKRAVLLVNAVQTEKLEIQPVQEEEEKKSAKGSKDREKGKSGRDSKIGGRKSRAQREREERQREEEVAAQLAKEQEAAAAAAADQPYAPPSDLALLKMIDEVIEKLTPIATVREQVSILAEYVSEKMGGSVVQGQLASFPWELPLSQLKFEMKSNVVPLGSIKFGVHYHRALLFKVLADRLAIPCSLVRGEYNRAWNTVVLPKPTDNPTNPKFPPVEFLVDLIYEPGRLLEKGSFDGEQYLRL